jgi:hypothetical protein
MGVSDCWGCDEEDCDGCDACDGDDDDAREPDPGCVLGDRCVNPHPYHLSYECASVEMMEAWARESE